MVFGDWSEFVLRELRRFICIDRIVRLEGNLVFYEVESIGVRVKVKGDN